VDAATAAMPSQDPHVSLSLDDVYREHAGFVWRAVRRLGISPAEAEDVVHEVFLVVRRRLAEFDGRAALRSWLFGVARGVASNHRRGRTRAARRLELVPASASPETPEEAARRREAAALVREFLGALDADKRLVFELADIEGMRGPEIAAALGLNQNSVYSRLRAARERFAEFLRAREIGGEPS
jgi:RNA polymerase sigma-70 factor (ECF subfamily)